MLNFCSNGLLLPFVDIINKYLKYGQFPLKLKGSKIFPKLKKGNTTEPSNYKLISLVSIF